MAESIVQVTEGSGKKLHTWNRTIGANSVEDEYVLLGEPPIASYNIVGTTAAVSTANSHLLQIMAGASLNVRIRRIRIYETVLFTTLAIFSVQIFRLTTAGTGGTAITPAKRDNADGAAGMTAMALPTVKGTEGTQIDEPIVTVVAAATAGHVPQLWEWTQLPNEKPIIIPAGTTNGIAFKNPAAQAAGQLRIVVEADETSF